MPFLDIILQQSVVACFQTLLQWHRVYEFVAYERFAYLKQEMAIRICVFGVYLLTHGQTKYRIFELYWLN